MPHHQRGGRCICVSVCIFTTAGTYSASQSVTIGDATAGVTIYYTNEGFHRSEDCHHQLLGCNSGLHHRTRPGCSQVLPGCRGLRRLASRDHHLRYGWQDLLLHHQRSYSHHCFYEIHRDRRKRDRDSEGHCRENRLLRQRCRPVWLHHLSSPQEFGALGRDGTTSEAASLRWQKATAILGSVACPSYGFTSTSSSSPMYCIAR